jgi:hypothetical protein
MASRYRGFGIERKPAAVADAGLFRRLTLSCRQWIFAILPATSYELPNIPVRPSEDSHQKLAGLKAVGDCQDLIRSACHFDLLPNKVIRLHRALPGELR